MARKIFYSFHYDNDVFRVQQIRNIGAFEENVPASPNRWEEVKRGGDASIKKWINENMTNKSCVIVLIGSETADRKWVQYEIEKAWKDGRGLLGIYIHNLKCPKNGTCKKGKNPFDQYTFKESGKKLSTVVKTYDPKSSDAYNDIKKNLEGWIEEAITIRK